MTNKKLVVLGWKFRCCYLTQNFLSWRNCSWLHNRWLNFQLRQQNTSLTSVTLLLSYVASRIADLKVFVERRRGLHCKVTSGEVGAVQYALAKLRMSSTVTRLMLFAIRLRRNVDVHSCLLPIIAPKHYYVCMSVISSSSSSSTFISDHSPYNKS